MTKWVEKSIKWVQVTIRACRGFGDLQKGFMVASKTSGGPSGNKACAWLTWVLLWLDFGVTLVLLWSWLRCDLLGLNCDWCDFLV